MTAPVTPVRFLRGGLLAPESLESVRIDGRITRAIGDLPLEFNPWRSGLSRAVARTH
jgi:hypothetical protein